MYHQFFCIIYWKYLSRTTALRGVGKGELIKTTSAVHFFFVAKKFLLPLIVHSGREGVATEVVINKLIMLHVHLHSITHQVQIEPTVVVFFRGYHYHCFYSLHPELRIAVQNHLDVVLIFPSLPCCTVWWHSWSQRGGPFLVQLPFHISVVKMFSLEGLLYYWS